MTSPGDKQLVCEWNGARPGLFQKGMRVVLDQSEGTVIFQWCHRPRRFWSVGHDSEYTCRIDEIRAVYVEWNFPFNSRHGRIAVISTPDGRAEINSRMAGFKEMIAELKKDVQTNRGHFLDNPNLWYVGIVLLALGISAVGLYWALS